MKKTLVLASLLAAFGAASAQSSVTLSGTVTGSYGSVKDTVNSVAVNNATGNAGNQYAERGFRINDVTIRVSGTEALGNGLTATFSTALEQSSSARGNAMNRIDTSLALNGGFGSFGIANTRGSDLMVTVGMPAGVSLTNGIYDMGTTNAFLAAGYSNIVSRSPIDLVSFTSTRMSGVQFGVSHSESSDDGSGVPKTKTNTLSANYVAGPLTIAAAYKASSNPAFVSGVRKSNLELAGNYNFGFATVGLGFDGKRTGTSTTSTTEKSAIGFGVSVPMGATTLGLNYAKRGTAKLVEASANYALSPRTSAQLAFGNQTGMSGTVDAKRSQARLRLTHNF